RLEVDRIDPWVAPPGGQDEQVVRECEVRGHEKQSNCCKLDPSRLSAHERPLLSNLMLEKIGHPSTEMGKSQMIGNTLFRRSGAAASETRWRGQSGDRQKRKRRHCAAVAIRRSAAEDLSRRASASARRTPQHNR